MYIRKQERTEADVLSIEEYLDKRKARKGTKDPDMPDEVIPFELYLSSSLSLS